MIIGGANETDFVITRGDKQFYVEVKCFNRENIDLETKRGEDQIATNILSALSQMHRTLVKWETNEQIRFNKKFLLTNYAQEDIDRVAESNKQLGTRLARDMNKVFGYNSLNKFIEEEIKGKET